MPMYFLEALTDEMRNERVENMKSKNWNEGCWDNFGRKCEFASHSKRMPTTNIFTEKSVSRMVIHRRTLMLVKKSVASITGGQPFLSQMAPFNCKKHSWLYYFWLMCNCASLQNKQNLQLNWSCCRNIS